MNGPSLETRMQGLQACPSLSIALKYVPHLMALLSNIPTAEIHFSMLSTASLLTLGARRGTCLHLSSDVS